MGLKMKEIDGLIAFDVVPPKGKMRNAEVIPARLLTNQHPFPYALNAETRPGPHGRAIISGKPLFGNHGPDFLGVGPFSPPGYCRAELDLTGKMRSKLPLDTGREEEDSGQVFPWVEKARFKAERTAWFLLGSFWRPVCSRLLGDDLAFANNSAYWPMKERFSLAAVAVVVSIFAPQFGGSGNTSRALENVEKNSLLPPCDLASALIGQQRSWLLQGSRSISSPDPLPWD
jgi:hypothetical protein